MISSAKSKGFKPALVHRKTHFRIILTLFKIFYNWGNNRLLAQNLLSG
jgi:hypothetical protein